MNISDKVEILRLAVQIARKSAQSAALNASALQLYSTGDNAKAHEKGQLSNNAANESEQAYQDLRTLLDKL